MPDPDLRIGTFRYDTTQALFDGTAEIPGVSNVEMATGATLPEVFRLLLDGEVDVAEFGMTFYLRALEREADVVALPAFPNRVFRHSCVFVNRDSGISGPADLVGRTIGEFGVYGQDSGVWAKGILMDEYGFRPEENRWVIGGLDTPAPPFGFVPQVWPEGIDISAAPEGRALGPMLDSGELDVLFTANVPQTVLDGSPHVTRLFPDFETRERDYYRRTGIFPMMHTVVVRRDLLTRHPWVARAVYEGFLAAKEAGARRYRQGRRLYEAPFMVPWLNALYEENAELMTEDWWPYGVAANRAALDTLLRYHHEQGLTAHRWTIEEIFTPDLLET
ncbi:4,5-dihydroxyphthalate decarboxylase [Streptomyces antimycoticus]|uniref:4,5-dihydroxyphthalate decarboxylase n=1 Tax=Streptomyces antimycoticus TaxID=68175 RepID=A0A499V069_9ACTN|nr:PhnD/SsuA/transferrin family substrate-binding protein [Streptomyces antimycoticus]BBJ45738.1 4,5-dihydroxyphthalate decarboxylase [Streptomyces antimycoticus]